MNELPTFDFYHVDAHNDTMPWFFDEAVEFLAGNDPTSLSIESYLRAECDEDEKLAPFGARTSIFQWDNFIPPFLKHHQATLESVHFALHETSADRVRNHNEFRFPKCADHVYGLWNLHQNLKYAGEERPVVVDVDLDYFVFGDDDRQPMFSGDYFDTFFEILRRGLDDSRISVCTIAMSPECCGGWAVAEEMLAVAARILGIENPLGNLDEQRPP